MNKTIFLILCAMACALRSAQAQELGNVLPFQGQLANQTGVPLTPSNAVTLVFRIYRSVVGGVPIWEEAQPNISVNAGRFSVLLGSHVELPGTTNFNSTLYLGITVDDGNPGTVDVELRPRQALVPVIASSFAREANNSAKLAGNDWRSILVSGNDPGTLSARIRGNLIQESSIKLTQLDLASVTLSGLSGNTISYSGGNVGIGTINPSKKLEVHAAGDAEIGLQSDDPGGRLWTIQSSGTSGNFLDGTFQIIDRSAPAARMIMTPNGNVAIGAINPSEKLHVAGNYLRVECAAGQAAYMGNSGPFLGVSFGSLNPNVREINFFNPSVGFMNAFMNDGTAFGNITTCGYVAAGGNVAATGDVIAGGSVGIGTPSPSKKLEVHAAGDVEIGLQSDDPGGRLWTIQSSGNGVAGLEQTFQIIDRTAQVARMIVHPNGRMDVNGEIYATGDVHSHGVILISDQRLKKNIAPIENPSKAISHLRGVTFEWNPMDGRTNGYSCGRQIGFLAQEVQKVLPEVVTEDVDGYLRMNYNAITPVLVEAVKEQQHQIDQLKAELASLKAALRR